MCPYTIFKNISIFLTVVATIPCVIVPIISITISRWVAQLVRCPTWLWLAFTCSMSKLLIVKTLSIKSLCWRSLEVALVHLVSFLLIYAFGIILRTMLLIISLVHVPFYMLPHNVFLFKSDWNTSLHIALVN